jgi:hypothetical protein
MLPLKFNSEEYPSFQVWAKRMKERSSTFKFHNQGQQRDQYYKERESFNRQKKDAEKSLADNYKANSNLTSDTLNLSITELATIGLGVINAADFKQLEMIASMLKNPLHLQEALREFTDEMRDDFSGAIKDYINKKTYINLNDYDEPKLNRQLQDLIDTCVEMSRPVVAEKIGLGAADAINNLVAKSAIRKTTKWED